MSGGEEPQEGRQSRERPANLTGNETLEQRELGSLASRDPELHEGRLGEGRADLGEGEHPGGAKDPGELRTAAWPNPSVAVADSRVEQDPEVEARTACPYFVGIGTSVPRFRHGPPRCVSQRREGSGVGDDERLRERNKALEGEPHERNRYETRPAGVGRSGVRGLRKPEGAGGQAR